MFICLDGFLAHFVQKLTALHPCIPLYKQNPQFSTFQRNPTHQNKEDRLEHACMQPFSPPTTDSKQKKGFEEE